MGTKKKATNDELVRDLARVGVVAALEPTDYFTTATTLEGAAALLQQLVVRQPAGAGTTVVAALEHLKGAAARTHAALQVLDAQTGSPVGEARNGMVSAVAVVTGTLRTQARSTTTLGARARAAERQVFGGRKRALYNMAPRAVWVVGERARKALEGSPALRTELETLVQPEAVTALLEAHRRLGEATGMVRPVDAVVVDVRGLLAAVNVAITHYAVCVMGMATPGDSAAVLRAEAALRPLRELRAEKAVARRTAGKAAAEAEAEEEVDEEDAETDEVEAPNPTPAPAGAAPPRGAGEAPG